MYIQSDALLDVVYIHDHYDFLAEITNTWQHKRGTAAANSI